MSRRNVEEKHIEELGRSHIPGTDYVTIVVDVWAGERDDPATEILRYQATYNVVDVPETIALDDDRWGWSVAGPVITFEQLDAVQKSDTGAKHFRTEYQQMTDPEAYAGWDMRTQKELYTAMLDAIDVLAEDDGNEEAWAAIDAYRGHIAVKHEK